MVKCGCKVDMLKINRNESLRSQLIKYPQIETLLVHELTRVKSLKELARLRIRKCLDQRLISKAKQLSIPQQLIEYVCMSEIFGFRPNGSNAKSMISMTLTSAVSDSVINSSTLSSKSSFIVNSQKIFNNCWDSASQKQSLQPNPLPVLMKSEFSDEKKTRIFDRFTFGSDSKRKKQMTDMMAS